MSTLLMRVYNYIQLNIPLDITSRLQLFYLLDLMLNNIRKEIKTLISMTPLKEQFNVLSLNEITIYRKHSASL